MSNKHPSIADIHTAPHLGCASAEHVATGLVQQVHLFKFPDGIKVVDGSGNLYSVSEYRAAWILQVLRVHKDYALN